MLSIKIKDLPEKAHPLKHHPSSIAATKSLSSWKLDQDKMESLSHPRKPWWKKINT
jgi:hypothetical protein